MPKDSVGSGNQLIKDGTAQWADLVVQFVSGSSLERLIEVFDIVKKRYRDESCKLLINPNRIYEFERFIADIQEGGVIKMLTGLKNFLSEGGMEKNSINILLIAELTRAAGCNFTEFRSINSLRQLRDQINQIIQTLWSEDYQGRVSKHQRDKARQKELEREALPLSNIVILEEADLATEYKKNNPDQLVFSVEPDNKVKGSLLLKEHSTTQEPILLPIEQELLQKLQQYKTRTDETNKRLYRDIQHRCQMTSEQFFKTCIAVKSFDKSRSRTYNKGSYLVTKSNNQWRLYYINPSKNALLIDKKNGLDAYRFLQAQSTEPEQLTSEQLRHINKLLWAFVPSHKLNDSLITAMNIKMTYQPCKAVNKYTCTAVNQFVKDNHQPFELVLTKEGNDWLLYYIGTTQKVQTINLQSPKYKSAISLLAEWDLDPHKAWPQGTGKAGCEPEKLSTCELNGFIKAIGTLDCKTPLNKAKFSNISRLFGEKTKLPQKMNLAGNPCNP